jgi:3-oxoacyl-[acyl-carrier protein] reductase
MKLKDKKAYITGGSSGIGAAIAVLFAKEGADISFCHFKDDVKATLVNDKITGYNRKCFTQNIDIGKKNNCDDFFQKSLEAIGEPDILVNNAGIIHVRPFEDATESEFDETINVHLKSTFFLTQNCYKIMKKNKSGRIINISSQLVFSGGPNRTDYCAAKGGIFSFTRALSLEAINHNILVNNIAPGVAQTALLDGIDQNVLDQAKEIIPMKRFADPNEIAPTALLLASEDGSFYCGATLSPNGGEVMV